MIRHRHHTWMRRVWADDFHHQVHVTLTGERDGYYRAYDPGPSDMARVIEQGWLYEGQHYLPTGASAASRRATSPRNHSSIAFKTTDQVGNRALANVCRPPFHSTRTAQHRPLLLLLRNDAPTFHGQEWAATSPFLYCYRPRGKNSSGHFGGRRRGVQVVFPRSPILTPAPRSPIRKRPKPFDARSFDGKNVNRKGTNAFLRIYRELIALRRTDPSQPRIARRLRAVGHDEWLTVRQWYWFGPGAFSS